MFKKIGYNSDRLHPALFLKTLTQDTKFLCLAQELYYGSKAFYVVIDLNTNQAARFEPSKPIRFAAFVNDTTMLFG